MMDRRKLITGLVSLIAAPAIVRASSLMPVKAWHHDLHYFPINMDFSTDAVIRARFRRMGSSDWRLVEWNLAAREPLMLESGDYDHLTVIPAAAA
jgi:hypothetical protein